MLTATLTLLASTIVCILVWLAVRRSRSVERVTGYLSDPVEHMQEQILLTADSAVDRLDDKIAQMEILLAEIDRRTTVLAQQSKQQQLQQLQIEQQQQQLASWIKSQRQQIESEFELRRDVISKIHAPAPAAAPAPATPPLSPEPERRVRTVRPDAADHTPPQDKRALILDLAEKGVPVTEIARQMGVGKGEVMLLLKLRKKAVP